MDKNEKLAAKFAEKRPKAAKLEELENKPVKLNTVGVKTDQPKEWLDRFSEKTIDSLHESWAAAGEFKTYGYICLLYTSDAADDTPCVDLGGRRIIKKCGLLYSRGCRDR